MGWIARLLGLGGGERRTKAPTAPSRPQPPRPPADWTDEPGWDDFHAGAQVPERPSPHDLGLQYVASFRAEGLRRVWFPGAGTSAAPRAFAQLGFDVVSSDVSAIAVAAQERLVREPFDIDLGELNEGADSGHSPTVLHVIKHDFREPLELPPFDVVLNRRAFQGFAPEVQATVARVHHDAVRPGGWAIFETMNVAAEHRDALEDALLEAGFVVPLSESNRIDGIGPRSRRRAFASS